MCDYEIPGGLVYSKEDEWVRLEEGGEGRKAPAAGGIPGKPGSLWACKGLIVPNDFDDNDF